MKPRSGDVPPFYQVRVTTSLSMFQWGNRLPSTRNKDEKVGARKGGGRNKTATSFRTRKKNANSKASTYSFAKQKGDKVCHGEEGGGGARRGLFRDGQLDLAKYQRGSSKMNRCNGNPKGEEPNQRGPRGKGCRKGGHKGRGKMV